MGYFICLQLLPLNYASNSYEAAPHKTHTAHNERGTDHPAVGNPPSVDKTARNGAIRQHGRQTQHVQRLDPWAVFRIRLLLNTVRTAEDRYDRPDLLLGRDASRVCRSIR